MEAAPRHGRDYHHADARIGDADLRCGDGPRVRARIDARNRDGRREPEERGLEAGEGHFDSDRHAGPIVGPFAEYEGIQLRKPAMSGDRRGGPHSADRIRGGHEGDHASAPQETPDHAVLRHAGQERAGLGEALAVGRRRWVARSQDNPVYIGVHDACEEATVSRLEQGYVVCGSDQRFLLLYTFLKKNIQKKKIM